MEAGSLATEHNVFNVSINTPARRLFRSSAWSVDDLHDPAGIRINQNRVISNDEILVFHVGYVDRMQFDGAGQSRADIEFDAEQANRCKMLLVHVFAYDSLLFGSNHDDVLCDGRTNTGDKDKPGGGSDKILSR